MKNIEKNNENLIPAIVVLGWAILITVIALVVT